MATITRRCQEEPENRNSDTKSIGGTSEDENNINLIGEDPKDEGRAKLMHRSASCRFGSLRLKGAVHVDYVLAMGLFLVAFAFVITYTTDYYSTVKETAAVMEKRSEAISLLSMAERSPEPERWPELRANESMVLLMHLNNNTLDYSGQGNNGTMSGANCSSSVWGRFYSGCSFDGIDDFISVTDSASLDTAFGTETFTLAAWVYPVDREKYYGIITKRDNNYYSAQPAGLFYDDRGFVAVIGTGNPEESSHQVVYNDSSILNRWNHVVATANGTNLSLYVDGVFRNSATITLNPPSNDEALRIGYFYGQSKGYFNGTIDEVAIYNRSLSAAEISGLYRQSLNRIGMHTYAYRLYIGVNNTLDYRMNKTVNSTSLENELVSFNLTAVLGGADKFSVAVYDDNGSSVPYQINDENITFVANVSINSTRWYTVYFDDDSLFPDSSAAVSGTDNLTETITPYERIDVLQYEKIRQLNSSDYSSVKNSSGIENNFNVQVYDTLTNTTFEDFGGTAPGKGDIIALERYTVFQNSTAGIRQGKIIVKVW